MWLRCVVQSDGFEMFDPRGFTAPQPKAAAPPQPQPQPQAQVSGGGGVEWDPFTSTAPAPAPAPAPAAKAPVHIPVDLFDRPAPAHAQQPTAHNAQNAQNTADIDFGDFKSAEPPKKAAPKDALWSSSLVGGSDFSLTAAPAPYVPCYLSISIPILPSLCCRCGSRAALLSVALTFGGVCSKPAANTGPKPSMSTMKQLAGGAGSSSSSSSGSSTADFFFGGASAAPPLFPPAFGGAPAYPPT
jgi:hypothetical protein